MALGGLDRCVKLLPIRSKPYGLEKYPLSPRPFATPTSRHRIRRYISRGKSTSSSPRYRLIALIVFVRVQWQYGDWILRFFMPRAALATVHHLRDNH